jgi:hypothetical protein
VVILEKPNAFVVKIIKISKRCMRRRRRRPDPVAVGRDSRRRRALLRAVTAPTTHVFNVVCTVQAGSRAGPTSTSPATPARRWGRPGLPVSDPGGRRRRSRGASGCRHVLVTSSMARRRGPALAQHRCAAARGMRRGGQGHDARARRPRAPLSPGGTSTPRTACSGRRSCSPSPTARTLTSYRPRYVSWALAPTTMFSSAQATASASYLNLPFRFHPANVPSHSAARWPCSSRRRSSSSTRGRGRAACTASSTSARGPVLTFCSTAGRASCSSHEML